ncbi:hypothetical protein B0H14DRAFT_2350989, partial [Mycena olivaceomarginata]
FLRPFQPPVKKKGTAAIDDDNSDMDNDDMDSELSLELDDDESLPDLADVSDTESMVDEEDQDAWDQMDEADKADMLAQTKAAKSVISRICNFSFALVHSTTKSLPAWRTACKAKKMAMRLLPRDVRTCWNSTYDMLVVAVQYKEVLNAVTADCNLPLRRYELSDSDWVIIEDLVYTLEVCASFHVRRLMLYSHQA